MFVGWLVLTIVGGAKALQGEDWKNPVKHVIKVEALSERERRWSSPNGARDESGRRRWQR